MHDFASIYEIFIDVFFVTKISVSCNSVCILFSGVILYVFYFQGKIDFFIDCSALASPRFEGREGKELGTEIYNALVSVYCQGAVTSNLEKLCIVSGKHCWLLNVDIVILECAGGSLYDVISLAIKAALFDTHVSQYSFAFYLVY